MLRGGGSDNLTPPSSEQQTQEQQPATTQDNSEQAANIPALLLPRGEQGRVLTEAPADNGQNSPQILPVFRDEEENAPVVLPSFPDEEENAPVVLPSYPDEEENRPVTLPSFPDEEETKLDNTYFNSDFVQNDGYIVTYSDNKEGIIYSGQKVSVSCNNHKGEEPVPEFGTLKISKTVVSENEKDLDRQFEFKIKLYNVTGVVPANESIVFASDNTATIMLKHGESKEIVLPTGTTYTVEEIHGENFEFDVTFEGEAGTISKDRTSEAKFTNTREESPTPPVTPPTDPEEPEEPPKEPEAEFGKLIISKTVVSDNQADLEKEFEFAITLSDENGMPFSGSLSGIEFVNGEAKVNIKHEGTVEIDNIPIGFVYTVTEMAYDDFEAVYQNESGSIMSELTEVSVINNRKEPEEPSEPDTDINDPDTPTTGVDLEPEFNLDDGDVPLAGADADEEVNLGDDDIPLAGADTDGEVDLGDDGIPLGGAEPTSARLDNVPKTGDETNMLNWILMFSVSVLGTGAVLSVLKKNDENN